MFKRGTVVQHKTEQWIGVALQPEEGHYVAVKWFDGRSGGGHVLIDEVTPIDGYEFEAALALGDTEKALEMYRALQVDQRQVQQLEANVRRLQASINVIGQQLANSTDEVVRELTGEKPYFMPGIISAVQFLVDAHTKLQAALEPFAAYGRLKLRYPANAVFTIAYDREGHEVILLFEDFTRAAELLPNAVGRTSKTTAMGGAGGIAEIANNATQEREYRVQYEMNGEASVGRVLADSPEHAARLVRESVPGATNVNVLVLNPTGVRP